MKKSSYIIFLLLFLLKIESLQSQTFVIQQGFYITNLNHYINSKIDLLDKEYRFNTYTFRIESVFKLNRYISIIAGIGREERGYHGSYFDNNGLPDRFNFKYKYFTLPILLEVGFKSKIRPYILLGSTFAYKTYGVMIGERYNNSGNGLNLFDPSNAPKLDFGINTGLGIGFPIYKRIGIKLETRLSHSVRNIGVENNYHAGICGTIGISYLLK